MLDEIDSGLDVDALRIVADAIGECQKETGLGMIVVSHYARFLDYLHPTHAAGRFSGPPGCARPLTA